MTGKVVLLAKISGCANRSCSNPQPWVLRNHYVRAIVHARAVRYRGQPSAWHRLQEHATICRENSGLLRSAESARLGNSLRVTRRSQECRHFFAPGDTSSACQLSVTLVTDLTSCPTKLAVAAYNPSDVDTLATYFVPQDVLTQL